MKRGSALSVLFLTIFIDLLGFGVIIPILPSYSKEIGASNFMVGVIAASFSLMQFLFTPIWGSLSDRYGRRPVILGTTIVSTVAYLIFSHATVLPILILSRCLSGLGSGNISAAQAYITDITPPEKRAQSMGLIGAAFGLGMIFGPPAGGLIKSHLGVEYIGYITAGLCLLNFVLAYILLPESLKEKNKRKIDIHLILPVKEYVQVFYQKGKREIFLINGIYVTAFFMFQITAALIWKEVYHFSEDKIGYIFAFIGVCTTIMQGGLIGFFTRRFGEQRLLFMGTVLLMICLASMPFVTAKWFVPFELILLMFLAIANGMVGPSCLSLLSQMSARHEQGRTLGLYQSFSSIARIIGPMLGTAMYAFDVKLPYLAGAAILLVNVYLAVVVQRHFKRLSAVEVAGSEEGG